MAAGLLVASFAPRTAHAEPARQRASDFWAVGAASVGVGVGSYRFVGLSAPGFSPRRVLALEADLRPALLGFSGAFGYHLTRYAALGIGGELMVLQTHARLGETSLDEGYLASIGLSGELRPMVQGGFLFWHVGFAQGAFAGDTQSVGAADNIVTLNTLSGYMTRLGFGWSFGSVAPVFSITRVQMSAREGRSTVRSVFLDAGVSFQGW